MTQSRSDTAHDAVDARVWQTHTHTRQVRVSAATHHDEHHMHHKKIYDAVIHTWVPHTQNFLTQRLDRSAQHTRVPTTHCGKFRRMSILDVITRGSVHEPSCDNNTHACDELQCRRHPQVPTHKHDTRKLWEHHDEYKHAERLWARCGAYISIILTCESACDQLMHEVHPRPEPMGFPHTATGSALL